MFLKNSKFKYYKKTTMASTMFVNPALVKISTAFRPFVEWTNFLERAIVQLASEYKQRIDGANLILQSMPSEIERKKQNNLVVKEQVNKLTSSMQAQYNYLQQCLQHEKTQYAQGSSRTAALNTAANEVTNCRNRLNELKRTNESKFTESINRINENKQRITACEDEFKRRTMHTHEEVKRQTMQGDEEARRKRAQEELKRQTMQADEEVKIFRPLFTHVGQAINESKLKADFLEADFRNTFEGQNCINNIGHNDLVNEVVRKYVRDYKELKSLQDYLIKTPLDNRFCNAYAKFIIERAETEAKTASEQKVIVEEFKLILRDVIQDKSKKLGNTRNGFFNAIRFAFGQDARANRESYIEPFIKEIPELNSIYTYLKNLPTVTTASGAIDKTPDSALTRWSIIYINQAKESAKKGT